MIQPNISYLNNPDFQKGSKRPELIELPVQG